MSDVTEPQVEKLDINDDKSTIVSQEEFKNIHPLSHEWSFWYLKPAVANDPNVNWSDLLHEIVTVDSVEHFWGAFKSMPDLVQLPLRSDMGIFRKGLRPEWEDPAFSKGGKWTCQLRVSDEADVDTKWENVVLSLIGGLLDGESEDGVALGAFALARKGVIKIQLWVNTDAQGSIEAAKKFKTALQLHEHKKIEYQPFNEEKNPDSLTVMIQL